jgi:hypothetical protein
MQVGGWVLCVSGCNLLLRDCCCCCCCYPTVLKRGDFGKKFWEEVWDFLFEFCFVSAVAVVAPIFYVCFCCGGK